MDLHESQRWNSGATSDVHSDVHSDIRCDAHGDAPAEIGSNADGANTDASAHAFSELDWRRLLLHIGENPSRQGLLETPKRVGKAWQEWASGYAEDPADFLKTFEDGAEPSGSMIVVRAIPVYSHCEHHMAPFFGTATIGYVPQGRIVGLSKLTRLVGCFSRRLQVQERLTSQIATALMTHVGPSAVGVIVRCRHLCMESRGVRAAGEETTTSAFLGELRNSATLRDEFFALTR